MVSEPDMVDKPQTAKTCFSVELYKQIAIASKLTPIWYPGRSTEAQSKNNSVLSKKLRSQDLHLVS